MGIVRRAVARKLNLTPGEWAFVAVFVFALLFTLLMVLWPHP